MTRWFRVYNDLVDDPKVQRIDPSLFKALINVWCLTSANDGVLPPIDVVAFKLRMTPKKAQRVLSRLQEEGLLDDDEKGLHPHNWAVRQHNSDAVGDQTAAERMRRYRNKSRNSAVTPDITLRRPETEAETEAESKTPSQGSTNSIGEARAYANGRRVPA